MNKHLLKLIGPNYALLHKQFKKFIFSITKTVECKTAFYIRKFLPCLWFLNFKFLSRIDRIKQIQNNILMNTTYPILPNYLIQTIMYCAFIIFYNLIIIDEYLRIYPLIKKIS